MLRFLKVVFALLAGLALIFSQSQAQAKAPAATDVRVEGEHWAEPLHGKIWIEDGTRLQAQTQGGQVFWSALKSGVIDVKNGDIEKTVTVLTLRQKKTLAALQESAKRTLGLHVELVQGAVEVNGELLRFADWENLAAPCAKFRCHYHFMATVPPNLVEESTRQFEKKFIQISNYPYKIELRRGATLHTTVKDAAKLQFQSLLDRYGIELIEDKNTIELTPLVKVQITLAEVRHSADVSFGAKWTTNYSAQILPNLATSSGSLTADLVANDLHGINKILASPNLLCNSGKEAQFLAGGEFPIRILNYKIQDVVWKQYGIVLKVKPLADLNGRMSIYIETEVSSLDFSPASTDGIPALTINRVQSYFDLTKPQTIALSGLLKKEDGQTSNGLPLLSRIPVLGALFSSKDYQDNKTELVIFVRPEIVNLEPERLTKNEK